MNNSLYNLPDHLNIHSPIAELTEETCELITGPPSADCPMLSSPMAGVEEADSFIGEMLYQKRTCDQILSPEFSIPNETEDFDKDWVFPALPEYGVENFADIYNLPHDFVVAPVMSQEFGQRWTALCEDIPTPTFSTAADPDTFGAKMPVSTTRRPRKSALAAASPCVTTEKTGDIVLFEEDLKPKALITYIENITSSPPAVRGRKRSEAAASPSPQHIACKKIKKYEIDDDESPSVRNARAAKANRDKKKKELVDLKEQGEAKDIIIRHLREDNVSLTKQVRHLQQLLAKELHIQQSTMGLVKVKDDMNKVLASTLPGMISQFGPIPTVILDPGFEAPRPPGRYVSTHFNLDSNTLIIGNPRKTF